MQFVFNCNSDFEFILPWKLIHQQKTQQIFERYKYLDHHVHLLSLIKNCVHSPSISEQIETQKSENMFEKLKSVRSEYLSRSPKGKWQFVRDIGILVLKTTGVPVLDPKFEVYWYSYAAGLVIFDVTLSFIHSVWYFMGRDPIKGVLNIPLYFGVLVPVRYISNSTGKYQYINFHVYPLSESLRSHMFWY